MASRDHCGPIGVFKYRKVDLVMLLLHFFLLGLQLHEALVGRLEQEVGLHGAVLVLHSE